MRYPHVRFGSLRETCRFQRTEPLIWLFPAKDRLSPEKVTAQIRYGGIRKLTIDDAKRGAEWQHSGSGKRCDEHDER